MIVWDFDPSGIYSPRAGYKKLSVGAVLGDERWWWKKLWKLHCPPKTRIFMWCVLENKVPTWDVLQHRSFQGPGWCCLCKADDELVNHLFLSCPFIKGVWLECSRLLGLLCRWEGLNVSQAWDAWWASHAEQNLKALPLLVIWGCWLAHNRLLF